MTKLPDANIDFKGTKVACVGDSLTFGTTLLNRKRECYPSRLGRLLGENFDVLNLGFPGYAINPFCEKYWGALDAVELLENYAPQFILFLLGTNDARLKNWTDEKTFEKFYRRFIHNFVNMKQNPCVIAMTSPRAYCDHVLTELDFRHEILADIVSIQRRVLAENGIPYIDLYSLTEGKDALYSLDKLHFNSKGAKFVAFKSYYAIKEQLNKNFEENLVKNC